ncbi:hypothetical protein ABGB07_36295 [Micromonosporaceae bacterium B7E4]
MSLHHALGVTRNAGRHRPGDSQPVNGRRLIPAEQRVPADWTPLAGWIRQQTTGPDTYIPAANPLELTGRLDPSEVLS